MEIALSINGVPIRLTEERWTHIVENHDDLAGRMDEVLAAIEDPDWISRGYKDSLIAWKGIGRKSYIAVIYKEIASNDGFVITAHITSKADKKDKIWP